MPSTGTRDLFLVFLFSNIQIAIVLCIRFKAQKMTVEVVAPGLFGEKKNLYFSGARHYSLVN